jgi:hypothetical protein
MKDGKRTKEEDEAVAVWNAHGMEVTEAAMKRFLVPWFTGARELVRANFPLQSVGALVPYFAAKKHFVILGSGPSAPEILSKLPIRDDLVILCGPTCVGAMLVANRKPDVLLLADSNPDQYKVLRDADPPDAKSWIVVLPVTCDPQLYAEDSIFDRKNIYFYLPFLDAMGSVDIAYNDILHVLFPDVHQYFKQAGSVGNAMIAFASMICGADNSKRIYLGLDCCSWLTKPPQLRALHAKRDNEGVYRFVETPMQAQQNREEAEDSFTIPTPTFDLQTNLISLGYAVQMFYMVHYEEIAANHAHRYAFIAESSRLFIALAPEETLPLAWANEVGDEELPDPLSSPDWSYATMLKVIVASNKHKASLIEVYAKEQQNVQDKKASLVLRLAEGAGRLYRRILQR